MKQCNVLEKMAQQTHGKRKSSDSYENLDADFTYYVKD